MVDIVDGLVRDILLKMGKDLKYMSLKSPDVVPVSQTGLTVSPFGKRALRISFTYQL